MPVSAPFTPDLSSTKGEGLTRYVAEFVLETAYEAIPEAVLTLGKKSMLDGLGLALAGSIAETGRLVQAYLKSLGVQAGAATVIGTELKAPERFAAFANGVGMHADDYDDTQLAVGADRVYGLLTHPTAPALPAVLAIAESHKLSGKDLMLAYQLGVEVECKAAEAISPRHYQQGFHTTATCGCLASAVGAGKLYGLDQAVVPVVGCAGRREANGVGDFGSEPELLESQGQVVVVVEEEPAGARGENRQ